MVRELKRLKEYSSDKALKQYNEFKLNSKWDGKLTDGIKKVIIEQLRKDFSQKQIANVTLKGIISSKTIYNWINKGTIDEISKKTCHARGKSIEQMGEKRKFTVGKNIKYRPKSVEDRKEFGHFELDAIMSPRNTSGVCFARFVERKTRLYTAVKMPNRSSKSMKKSYNKDLEYIT